MKTKFNPGDKVAYSVQFLKSIGASHSDLARDRGIVTAIDKLGSMDLVSVNWRGDSPSKVNAVNLAKVGSNTRFCAC